MKLSISLALLAAFAFLSACEDEPPVRPVRRQPTSRYPAGPTQSQYPPAPQPYNGNSAPPPNEEVYHEETSTAPAATVAPVKTAQGDRPYGIPVPNKAGFVTSPFAPNQGYVDVRGFPPGTEVKDPYTNKIFLVP